MTITTTSEFSWYYPTDDGGEFLSMFSGVTIYGGYSAGGKLKTSLSSAASTR